MPLSKNIIISHSISVFGVICQTCSFFVAPSLELEAGIPLKVLCNPDWIRMSLAGIPLKVHYPVEPFNLKLQGLHFFLTSRNLQPS